MPWSRLLAAVALTAALAGCFSEILPVPEVSTLAFTCAVLDRDEVERVRIQSAVAPTSQLPRAAALAALAGQVVQLAGRAPGQVVLAERDAPAAPETGWNASTLAEWARGEAFLTRNQATLRVLWLEALDDPSRMGLVAAPATVALSEAAIASAAARLNHSSDEVARAVLLHFAGHALGVTNRGIPVQDPDLQVREGTPGHDADPASVMADGWEDARMASWAANATYDRYPDAAHADWQAARGPGGVCT